jgi:tripeptidyl-peptidase-1
MHNKGIHYTVTQTFYKKYRADAAGSTFSVELLNGGKNLQSTPGIEANLDVQVGAWA